MATDPIVFKHSRGELTIDKILASGEYFSGIVYLSKKMNNWIEFSLVNKEKLDYILRDINLNEEVNFEICSYAIYPEEVQRQGDRRRYISKRD